jgi:hypothetical protein
MRLAAVVVLSFASGLYAGDFVSGPKLIGTGGVGASQYQGFSVALSADGNTALLGAPEDAAGVGAAWVFVRTAGVWTQQGPKLIGTGASGTTPQHGSAVALSSDGNTALIGALGDNANVGAAWVFTRSNGNWTQQGAKLVGALSTGASQQGLSVALSADGNTALVGGPYDALNAGGAWVFTRSSGVWSPQGGKLLGSGPVGAAQQGISVALSADGNTALIGGWEDNSAAGAAWVFTRSGASWMPQGPKLVGAGATNPAKQGRGVALSADGNTAVLGGPSDNTTFGGIWVFTRSGSTWSPQSGKLVGSGAVGAAGQGLSVDLTPDGSTVIFGGPDDDGTIGGTWIFTRSGSTWSQQGLKLVGTGSSSLPQQGSGVALSADGKTALVGGFADNNYIGAAWVFTRECLGGDLNGDGNVDVADVFYMINFLFASGPSPTCY